MVLCQDVVDSNFHFWFMLSKQIYVRNFFLVLICWSFFYVNQQNKTINMRCDTGFAGGAENKISSDVCTSMGPSFRIHLKSKGDKTEHPSGFQGVLLLSAWDSSKSVSSSTTSCNQWGETWALEKNLKNIWRSRPN